ncbi:response regulator transcription factor [Streptomyces sp. NPDC058867]|uniref:response regulator transcription factor n=1 Tax=unclassified Streptomyces TaxID=2593676 RepID=UPI0036B17DEB
MTIRPNPCTTPPFDTNDRKILNLLYAGRSDASIARQLDMGHRTVQRRIQRLMEQLQANGRVALGARAQELGLLQPRRRERPVVNSDAADHGAGNSSSQR